MIVFFRYLNIKFEIQSSVFDNVFRTDFFFTQVFVDSNGVCHQFEFIVHLEEICKIRTTYKHYNWEIIIRQSIFPSKFKFKCCNVVMSYCIFVHGFSLLSVLAFVLLYSCHIVSSFKRYCKHCYKSREIG